MNVRRLCCPAIVLLAVLCAPAPVFGDDIQPHCKSGRRPADPLPQQDRARRPNTPDMLTFYALGDWGTADRRQQQVAELLRRDVQQLEQFPRKIPPFILGLGDAVYRYSERNQTWEERDEMAERLDRTFGSVYTGLSHQEQPVQFHVVPGNHDHDYEVRFLETLAEARYPYEAPLGQPVWRFYPTRHPDIADSNDKAEFEALQYHHLSLISLPQQVPVETELVRIAALDTYVFIRLYEKRYRAKHLPAYWRQLERIFAGSAAPWKIIIAHHPIASHGTHGRYRNIIGRFFRGLFRDSREDVSHPAYHRYLRDMKKFMKRHGIDLYVAGHDHSLQLIDLGTRRYQVISGSAGLNSEIKPCPDSIWAKSALGFARFDASPDHLWLEFLYLEEEESARSAVFRIDR